METLKKLLSALLKATAVLASSITAGVIIASLVKFLLVKIPGVTLAVLCALLIGFASYMFLRDENL